MSIYDQFGTNKQKETDGVRIEMPANDDKSVPVFIVSRMGKANKRYTKRFEALTRPYRRSIELGTLSEDIAEKLTLEAFVETILMGWDNVQDREGKALPFNASNAKKLMQDLPDLYEELQQASSKATLFRDEQTEADLKNS